MRAYETERTEEWLALLGARNRPLVAPDTPGWTDEQARRLLPCIPASGRDLQRLMTQIGLQAA